VQFLQHDELRTVGSQAANALGQPVHVLCPASTVVLLQDSYFQFFFHVLFLYAATASQLKIINLNTPQSR